MNCIKCKKGIPPDALYCPYCGKKQEAQRKRRKRANGMGTVYKHSGHRSKPWEAQKAGAHIGYFATKFEAEQALSRIADIPVSDSLNLTFSQVYDRWKPTHSRTLTESGVSGYEFAYSHCGPLYNSVFRKLRTSDFQSIINQMELDGLSKSSCGKVVQLFSQLSQWAIQEEICHTNYAKYLTVTAPQKSTKAVFTEAQISAIQASTSTAAPIALLLLSTGCRPNELFSALVENCAPDYFISGSKTEAGKNRVIPVSPLGKQAYACLLEAARASSGPRLIDGYNGNREYRNFVKRDWKRLMEEISAQDMTPYNCRHTYATYAVKSGMKPEILKQIMGHAAYTTTIDFYTHTNTAELIQESQKLAVTVTLQSHEIHPEKTPSKSSKNA